MMSVISVTFLCLIAFITTTNEAVATEASTTHLTSIQSLKLNTEVAVTIGLPESYSHSDAFKYPVYIVLDGSTQFDHIYGNTQFLSTYAVIPEMIVVGVAVTERLKHFTPKEHPDFLGRSGKADDYLAFLQQELLPQLKTTYRINDFVVISGHSLGGLFTSYLAIQKPDSFSAYISISPSLWWNNFELLSSEPLSTAANWYVSLANEPGEMAVGFAKLETIVTDASSSFPQTITQRFREETHDTTPLIGNINGIRTVFRDFNAIPNIEIKSLAQLHDYYKDYAQQSGYYFHMSAHQYNVYGLKAAYEQQPTWAIDILKAGTDVYPRSDMLWDSLATAYSLANQHSLAMMASMNALELAKQNKSKYLTEIKAQNQRLQQQAKP